MNPKKLKDNLEGIHPIILILFVGLFILGMLAAYHTGDNACRVDCSNYVKEQCTSHQDINPQIPGYPYLKIEVPANVQ